MFARSDFTLTEVGQLILLVNYYVALRNLSEFCLPLQLVVRISLMSHNVRGPQVCLWSTPRRYALHV